MNRLLCAAALCALLPLPAAAYTVETLQNNGPSDRRIDLVLLGDGYRAADQTKLHDDAVALVDNLFNLTPFKEYRTLFNVKLIHVISNETGADNGTYGVARDTALGAAFNCNNIDRLLCVDVTSVKVTAARDTPGYDLLVVIANDPKYGGSGGEVATVSLAASSGEILRHELGHSLGRLADEYSDPYPGYPACVKPDQPDCPEPNATVEGARATVKWSAWIAASTPVPTPATGAATELGAYEGCRYKTTGIYRPKDADCLMRVLSNPYCSVCVEGMVRAFWNKASPVDTFSPATPTPVTPCGPVTFSITTPALPTLTSFSWTLDGQMKAVNSLNFTLADTATTPGPHEVAVTVVDTTPLVRNDPLRALQDTQKWSVTVGPCTPGVCDETAGCGGGQCAKTFKPVGTACAAATCKDGSQVAASTCDGAGTCGVPLATSCDVYACDEGAAACRTSCKEDSHCAPGIVCFQGACTPPSLVPKPGCGCGNAGGAGGGLIGAALLAWLRRRRPAQAG